MKNRALLIVLFTLFTGFLFWFVSIRQSLLFIVGIGLGLALAGARFGFTTGWRNLIEQRDASGVLAQLVLLAIAAGISIPLLAKFPTELSAALGPPSISLLIGALVFGAAMQIADGCGSGTLYKAGLGIPLNMAILPVFALGSFLGSAHLGWWLELGHLQPVGLVTELGASKALLVTYIGLLVLGLAAWAWSKTAGPTRQLFNKTLLVGAVVIALLAVLNLLIAGQPWGVVYGFGLWAAKIAQATQLFDPTLNTFWSQPVNAAALEQSIFLDLTSITNLGILAGALWVFSRRSGQASQRLTAKQWMVGIIAGFLLGYSSRLAFGCNVGAMVSGISTGSLHGWIWVAMAFIGSLFGVRIRRYFGY
ncbi:YeeE/YedE [Thiopseudomonas alkaliphila]|uniref:YeeE/YedE family protein n=1 Tax=Thiopseudomonas alkaliphila TaxID=1697053 RepID=UPI00069F8198|nr:YeeE/YedE family protein [Thiopseudomonas alkaliphila]AKX44081.1 YeeE/YedE [Thiopseudomonas alkaliphila]AKX46318.1 YeeE/YedE [Thiopseudomonas alkaliphila]AKX49387.1 YeeE/YedE [Thiopseudomonas alkaliphila]AKX52703.1 YeeE/YedE [Thiopseudomonas alkaliphila]